MTTEGFCGRRRLSISFETLFAALRKIRVSGTIVLNGYKNLTKNHST
jgi:hypothetical protein